MNRFTKAAIATVAGFAATAVPLAQAQADHRRHWDDSGVVIRRDRHNDALAAGIIGLAAGAIIAGALTQPRRAPIYEARPVYRQAPAYDVYPDAPPAPRRSYVINYADDIEPWTRDWYRYCSDRYRSFNAETGTYRGYDGRNHFCEVN